MSWFTFNPVKYIQEEWNGESALGIYDPLHLVKELGHGIGLWEDKHPTHSNTESGIKADIPLLRTVNDWFNNFWNGWGSWLVEIGLVVLLVLFIVGLIAKKLTG